jgi:hypothetical protein
LSDLLQQNFCCHRGISEKFEFPVQHQSQLPVSNNTLGLQSNIRRIQTSISEGKLTFVIKRMKDRNGTFFNIRMFHKIITSARSCSMQLHEPTGQETKVYESLKRQTAFEKVTFTLLGL